MKKIAVIIPVFNIEKYIGECLDSVIDQTIGISNLQVIVINDGSTDQSLKIVEKYQQKYSDSFVVKSQENQGLSAARNAGMDLIDAEYTLFLDGDDLLELQACEQLYDCASRTEADMVIARMEYYPDKNGIFRFGYLFKKSGWIDLDQQAIEIPLSAGGKLYRSQILEGLRFNSDLRIQEDVEFNLRFLLEHKLIYFLHQTVYLYRQRAEQNSLFDNIYNNSVNYTNFANNCVLPIFLKLNNNDYQDSIRQLVVNHLLKSLMGYIKYADSKLTEIETREFLDTVQNVLELNSVENILFSSLTIEQKILLLSIKDIGQIGIKKSLPVKLNESGELLVTTKDKELNLGKPRKVFNVDFVSVGRENLNLEGYYHIEYLAAHSWAVICNVANNNYRGTQLDREYSDDYHNNLNHRFFITIPLADISDGFHSITFELGYKSDDALTKKIRLTEYDVSHQIFRQIKPIYKYGSEYLLKAQKNKIALQKKPITIKAFAKLSRLLKTNIVISMKLLKQKNWELFWLRQLAIVFQVLNKRKKIILFRDRRMYADDNAEHLFRYFCEQKPKNVKAIYVLDKNSEDYSRIKKVGKTVEMYSFSHKFYYLSAAAHISSHCEWEVFIDVNECSYYLGDLISHKRIFLDHGIIFRDFSASLNRHRQMIDLFVAKTKPEQAHILDNDYSYKRKQVPLLGMPRYDNLLNKNLTEKSILFMPTWRKELITKWRKGEQFEKIENIKSTKYFNCISQLLNNKYLVQILNDLNYKLIFHLHPGIEAYKDEFRIKPDVIKLGTGGSIQSVMKSSQLLVTDYSSIAFDYAYMKKPVIYYQFDESDFWGSDKEKSYFDFRRDGFGEVINHENKLIEKIKLYLENGCIMERQYLTRAENTFAFHDTDNCKRIFEATLGC